MIIPPVPAGAPSSPPRVALFVTCLVDAMRPSVGFAALKLLRDAGCRVEVPQAQTCCGQPAFNSGDTAHAATLARQHGMVDADRRRAVGMVERVLRLPVIEEARAAKRLYREVPLSGAGAGGLTNGRADLLFESRGQWQLVEFKTGDGASNSPRGHDSQVGAYSACMNDLVGGPVSVSLCLVREARVIEA